MDDILLKNAAYWVDADVKTRIIMSTLILAVCYLLRWWLDDWIKPYLPTQIFLFGSIAIAVLYGYVPAVISLVVGWMLGLYYFVEPYGQLTPASIFDIVITVNEFAEGLAGIALIEYLQRTRYSRRLNLLVSESRYRSLLRLDNHRVHQQRQAGRALRQIADVFSHLDRALLLIDPDGRVHALPLFERMTQGAIPMEGNDWLDAVHVDNRQHIADETQSVIQGKKENCPVRFRFAGTAEGTAFIDCEFRSLPVGAHQHAFALLLKPQPA
jgi:K+-sensing histidine kinase KdpD